MLERNKMAYYRNILIIHSLLLGVVAVTSGQKIKTTSCPALTSFASPTFTLDSIATTWKVIASSPSIHHLDWKCVTYTFATITSNSQYSIAISGRKTLFGTSRISGIATVTGGNAADSTAWTYFTFDITDGSKTYKWNYYIVLTDNSDFIALYACESFLFGRIESFLLLGQSGLTSAKITAALDAASQYGVTRSDLVYPYTAECL